MKKSSTLKSALVAVGGSLVAIPVAALELGEVKIHSTLGQPLRASIAYALGPNEAISDTCVTLRSTGTGNGLPSVNRASMIVADGVIAITGSAIVREPLMSMTLNIRCNYTAQLSREYMMFIDPVVMPPAPVSEPIAADTTAKPQIPATVVTAPVAAEAPVATRRRSVVIDPIDVGTRYQVPVGASLSEIAQQIENRPVGLWDAVDAIFAANPDAFLNNDPNQLKAGSWLDIPGFSADEPVAVAAEPTSVAEVSEPASVAEPVEPVAESTAYEPEPTAPLADLQPGDVILDTDSVFAAPIDSVSDESVVIPDTELPGPETVSESPNVPVAIIQPAAAAEPTSTNWLLWLGGAGVGLIVALLFFGRRFRGFGSSPIAPAVPQRRMSDGDTEQVAAIGDIDIDIPDDSPTHESLALDADLIVGTGLQDGTDVDVAQDFGFATSTDLDLELPEEMSSFADTPETDIIPPLGADESSILENEVMAEEVDDDYDMSVIVDATKMPHPDDVTERDLEAIQVESDDETLITGGDYTVSQEVDYKIVEQDYEDEMTATQALNAEIQKAAEDLAVRMDDDVDDATSEMRLATVHELDVTAQLPIKEDVISDDDDTGVNPTVNMETEGDTVQMKEDNTIEMPKGGKKTG